MNNLRKSSFVFLLFITTPIAALSAEHDDGHEDIEKSASLTFSLMLEAAINNSPQYLELRARGEQAQAYAEVGSNWISGRPSLELNYYDDTWQSNTGQKEMEYGVALPLWRLGEKRKAVILGENYTKQTSLWLNALTLDTAGKLRASLIAIQEAELIISFEEQAIIDAESLLTTTKALFQAGDISELELMQAQSLLLNQQETALQAEAALVDAVRDYAVFTGLELRPADAHIEIQSTLGDIQQTHPMLQYLQAAIAVAEANIQQTQSQAKGSPILTLGSRRDRGSLANEYIDSIGIALSIPFSGKSVVSSQVSQSRLEKVEAEVALQNIFRALDLQLHEVEHELSTAEQALVIKQEKNNLEQKRWRMAKLAFEVGEVDVTSVIIALQQANVSAKELELSQLNYQKLITEYNQVVGVLP